MCFPVICVGQKTNIKLRDDQTEERPLLRKLKTQENMEWTNIIPDSLSRILVIVATKIEGQCVTLINLQQIRAMPLCVFEWLPKTYNPSQHCK